MCNALSVLDCFDHRSGGMGCLRMRVSRGERVASAKSAEMKSNPQANLQPELHGFLCYPQFSLASLLWFVFITAVFFSILATGRSLRYYRAWYELGHAWMTLYGYPLNGNQLVYAEFAREAVVLEVLRSEAVRKRVCDRLSVAGVYSVDGQPLSEDVLSRHLAIVELDRAWPRIEATTRDAELSRRIVREVFFAADALVVESEELLRSRYLVYVETMLNDDIEWRAFQREYAAHAWGYEFKFPPNHALIAGRDIDMDIDNLPCDELYPYWTASVYVATAWAVLGCLCLAGRCWYLMRRRRNIKTGSGA